MRDRGQLITGPLKYLRRPLAANITSDQDVLIVTDTAADERVWQATMSIVSDLGASPTLAMFDPRPADYYDPPDAVAAAMLRADVVVLLASTAMLHSDSVTAAMNAAVPVVCMDSGITLELLQQGGATADYREVAWLRHVVGDRVFGTRAKEARVTTRHGSDLVYSVENRIFVPPPPATDLDPFKAWHRTSEGRKSSLYAIIFPSGEFNVPPVEGSANGTIVFDLTIHQIGRIADPIELTVEAGRITNIAGGIDAWTLNRYLEDYGDENAYNFPAEASVGTNPQSRVTGLQREDKNILGSMHFGLGTNVDVGGTIKSRIHMDGIVLQPTLTVDGITKIRDGQLLVRTGRIDGDDG